METPTSSAASVGHSEEGLRLKADDFECLNDMPLEGSAPSTPGDVGKNAFGDDFRNYANSKRQEEVERNYREDHTKMTVGVVKEKMAKWLKFTHGEYTIMEVIEMLDELVDESDPDNELPNSIHDFQTAERIRKLYPGEEYDWFHLAGLLHDLGKVLALWGEPQWCVVGDTYPVGCQHSDQIVFPHFFETNPDTRHPVYSTKNGMYKPNCGITNLMMAWGHDEYMYWVLKENKCTLPLEALAVIRYHSFYPWHTHGAYTHFEAPQDKALKKWVVEFNKFDLYSKSDEVPNCEELKPYYAGLLKKYGIDGKLRW
eukprot:TRINITY_DN39200_c0_g1_i1.p1 TRINITY_DN39200_c0_g1~~TRINITY_DN39200_c0_g1_i1.p1  ORF type:complete len:327 (+),score=102.79 TRINITY_DN39200_c0_g1_i1:44-982(+)